MSQMGSKSMVKLLQQCQIAPPPGTVTDTSLPLTFLDIPWLHFPLIQHLLFFEFPHSKTYFMETTIPSLKHSLSLTLKHYFPLAGNLMLPQNNGKPLFCYREGDSVSLTFAESTHGFTDLIGNDARSAYDFYHLVPHLPSGFMSSDTLVVPLLAVQVTLFPNRGLCFGFTVRRVTGDGSAIHGFIRSWASVSKLGRDAELRASGSLPYYDRKVVKDRNDLETKFWNQVSKTRFVGVSQLEPPPSMVQATFVMTQAHVQQLKKEVTNKCSSKSIHVSTFTVTCAYVWSCMVKARAQCEQVDEKMEHFVFGANCRALLDPPVPETYFGNCLVNCVASLKCSQLVGNDGLLVAAEKIGVAIRQKLHNGVTVLKDAENWISDYEALNKDRITGVAGSPKFKVYDIDFGWERPKKSEVVSIDVTGSISLNECGDVKGGLEIGLSLAKNKMDAFASIFTNGLKVLD